MTEEEAQKNGPDLSTLLSPEDGVTDQDHYLSFGTKSFVRYVRPILQTRARGTDIVSRSVCLIAKGDFLYVSLTDQVSYGYVEIPCKANLFPSVVVTDIKSLFEIAKVSEKVLLIEREGKLFARFMGGELFLPFYRMDAKLYQVKLDALDYEDTLSSMEYLDALTALDNLVTSTDVPELSYFFVLADGVYACNGVTVAKYLGSFFPAPLRHRDYPIIKALLEEAKTAPVKFSRYPLFYRIGAPGFTYCYPVADIALSDEYKNKLTNTPKSFHTLKPSILFDILSILERMPGGSGTVDLSFDDNVEVKTRSKKGDVSKFTVPSMKQGNEDRGSVSVSIKTLLTTLRIFKNDTSVDVGVAEGALHLGTELKKASVILEV